ncbi:hypothetical protein A6F68_02913 [Tsuneonella dongtanensis]|uniref:Uncharacterized protein n=1 Tax=Tsuneonella dongtanensis TaxID=692370 RepID=A0A1B2AGX9_9SPHN|nr:hypothetical protein [Tsuneonella dongtanensis]ANY21399.1 hypothetical protein A6F68_02913 [Tsuneonella dongtanensis]
MNFDDLFYRYFGTDSVETLPAGARDAGVEKMQVDFGLSRDRGQRFALWSVLYMLGASPDLDVAFPDPSDRAAARNFMDLMAAADERLEP